MAKGQDLSAHQRKIVSRYYEHRDTIALNTLGELVSELYLADSEAKQARLWKRVETALVKLGPTDSRTRLIFENRDVEGLAGLVGELGGRK